jgi:Mg2+-importing ATPase
MNVLCSDKTGTITYGVVQLDGALDAEGQPSEEVFRLAYMNAHFQSGLANPLDQAILSKKSLDLSEVYKVDEVPYDFVRKRMSVLVKEQLQSKMITKGALESVLAVSKYVLLGDQRLALEDLGEQDLCKNFETWSEQGYRVLGLAIKDVSETTGTINTQDEKDLVFVGFLLFFDPPKEGVSQSIQDLNDLGVQLKIITGDNRLVAQHAAQMVGLSVQGVLTGAQLNDLRDEALWQTAERTTIFAEVDPNQKERIILALKKKGHVVGYMGDGINDAPALHSADVGISVDNAVDVAKEAADFVLLKQDLAVLHQGILQGRKTFANTLKYIFMATSANFGNMFSVAVGSLFLPFLPMLPKQILLINFLTDLPEMTIAGDNVDSEMLKKPQRWNISFIRRFMLVFGSLSSLFDLLTFGVLLWLFNAGQVLFHTGWFVESVLSASLVVFAVRTRLPISRSRPSRAMLVMTGLVGLVTLALPFSPLAPALDFSPLPRNYLLAIGAIVVAYIASAEATKRWFFRKMVG